MDLEISRKWMDLPWFLRSFFLFLSFFLSFCISLRPKIIGPWLFVSSGQSEKKKGSQYYFHFNEQKYRVQLMSGVVNRFLNPPALLTANIFRKHELYYSLQKTLGKFGPSSAVTLVTRNTQKLSDCRRLFLAAKPRSCSKAGMVLGKKCGQSSWFIALASFSHPCMNQAIHPYVNSLADCLERCIRLFIVVQPAGYGFYLGCKYLWCYPDFAL